jgi:hypothetical protein
MDSYLVGRVNIDPIDHIVTTKTASAMLNAALKRIRASNAELLMVLERPYPKDAGRGSGK